MKRAARGEKTARFDIHSVAALARVSIATVSRTINHVSTVDPELAARVWKAVEELHFIPNTQARALVSGRSRLLGLIVSEITNPFFPELVQEFEREAVAREYEIMLASTSYDRKKMDLCVRRLMERKVDGVAIMTFGIEGSALDLLADDQVPTVFIDAAPARPRSSVLTIDYRAGFREGIEHLKTLGHRRIGFISGPPGLRSADARRQIFCEEMRSAGLKIVDGWVVEGDHTLDGGRDAMRKLLKMARKPTAVMCSNDMTAIGVQHAVFEARLRVPEDLSLIGFDDIHLAEYTIPPLTTIRMACKDLAHAAVMNLLAEMDPEGSTVPGSQIPTRLIVRGTTAALAARSVRGR
jgi:LacI family transcriptional regulator